LEEYVAEILRKLQTASTKEEIELVLATFNASVSPEICQKAKDKATARLLSKRFTKYHKVLVDLIYHSIPLVDADTQKERYNQYQELLFHAEMIWEDSVALFKRGRYATALALAIVSLEEAGKISAARFHIVLPQETLARIRDEARERCRRGNPFFDHSKKHLLAAGGGALINARLDRIFGLDTVLEFLDDVEAGRIEHLRQSALYVDVDDDGRRLPHELISKEQATRYVVLAGECLAEILGFVPEEWKRLLTKVKQFEEEIGISAE